MSLSNKFYVSAIVLAGTLAAIFYFDKTKSEAAWKDVIAPEKAKAYCLSKEFENKAYAFFGSGQDIYITYLKNVPCDKAEFKDEREAASLTFQNIARDLKSTLTNLNNPRFDEPIEQLETLDYNLKNLKNNITTAIEITRLAHNNSESKDYMIEKGKELAKLQQTVETAISFSRLSWMNDFDARRAAFFLDSQISKYNCSNYKVGKIVREDFFYVDIKGCKPEGHGATIPPLLMF